MLPHTLVCSICYKQVCSKTIPFFFFFTSIFVCFSSLFFYLFFLTINFVNFGDMYYSSSNDSPTNLSKTYILLLNLAWTFFFAVENFTFQQFLLNFILSLSPSLSLSLSLPLKISHSHFISLRFPLLSHSLRLRERESNMNLKDSGK